MNSGMRTRSRNLHASARRRVSALLIVCVTTAALLGADPVSAHARLMKSRPAAEATLSTAPKAIALWFNESPEIEFSTIKVLDGVGKVLLEGALARTRQPNGLALTVTAPLPPDTYRVQYRVLSVDGHIVEGEFSFRIDTAPAAKGS